MSIENPESSAVKKFEASAFRHELIQEFREALSNEQYEVPDATEGIMVLSGPPSLEYRDDREKREKNPVNISRIAYAAELYKGLAAKKLQREREELTDADLNDAAVPPFVLNGETEQLQPMREIAIAIGIPEEKIILIDCGKRGIGNTKTQFVETVNDPNIGNAKQLVFVTSSYHTPRVERTAAAHLPEAMQFDIVGVPFKDFSYNVYRKIKGEVKRIVNYSAKGDITKYPRS